MLLIACNRSMIDENNAIILSNNKVFVEAFVVR